MAPANTPDLRQQLLIAHDQLQRLREEHQHLQRQVQCLEDEWSQYRPLCLAWLKQGMPSKEELEKELADFLAHPETWVSSEDFWKSIQEALNESRS